LQAVINRVAGQSSTRDIWLIDFNISRMVRHGMEGFAGELPRLFSLIYCSRVCMYLSCTRTAPSFPSQLRQIKSYIASVFDSIKIVSRVATEVRTEGCNFILI